MIRSLIATERDCRLHSIDALIDRTKALCNNPAIGNVVICGAIRGLDIPVRALASLALQFAERKFFVLSQSLDRIEITELLEIDSDEDKLQLSRQFNSLFPGVFTGDLVVCWGDSKRWHVLFDAQLSLGLLVVRSLDDQAMASEAYAVEDELLDVRQAFTECAAHEIRGLPENIREPTATALFDTWGVAGRGPKGQA
jgi:hypothetical protein